MITVPGLPPGVKLGLSNIVTMYCVFFLGWRQAYTLAVLKGSFALLTRGFTAACMSTAGGLVSVTVMLLLILPKKLDLSYTLISVLGSLGHNFRTAAYGVCDYEIRVCHLLSAYNGSIRRGNGRCPPAFSCV